MLQAAAVLTSHVLEDLRLPVSVDDGPLHAAGEEPIFDFEFVGEREIESEAILQGIHEEIEAAADQSDSNPEQLQCFHEFVASGGELEAFAEFEGAFQRQSGEQLDPFCECMLKIELPTHRPCRDLGDLVLDADQTCEFIDEL